MPDAYFLAYHLLNLRYCLWQKNLRQMRTKGKSVSVFGCLRSLATGKIQAEGTLVYNQITLFSSSTPSRISTPLAKYLEFDSQRGSIPSGVEVFSALGLDFTNHPFLILLKSSSMENTLSTIPTYT
jgi:hypothetical protein